MVHVIKNGLDLPIAGQPVQSVAEAKFVEPTSVGLVGDDYVGMRPTMLVAAGDRVITGQPLFEDKKNPGVMFTSPATGTVREVNRGAKRKFESVVIDIDDSSNEQFVEFPKYDSLREIGYDQVTTDLLQSGNWAALRTRPFSRSPIPGSVPWSIFVTAMDTNPLAPEAELIINEHKDEFVSGLNVLTNLLKPGAKQFVEVDEHHGGDSQPTQPPADAPEPMIYVCTSPTPHIPGADVPGVKFEEFKGPHPAGLAGTHIHELNPVGGNKTVWTIGYQDVIAIGFQFTQGRLMTQRTVSLAGPVIAEPRLVKTRLGACIDDIAAGQLQSDKSSKDNGGVRLISGSVLSGRKATSPVNYLGRFHNQISAIEEGTNREFLGWQKPGGDKHTVTGLYLGGWLKKKFNMTANLGGGHRTIVPIETFERVMPLDILPTQLLKSLVCGDTESAQALGCLELDEEDLALCTYVCPAKYEYGEILRKNLTQIEKEG